jgi:hypothetical protein
MLDILQDYLKDAATPELGAQIHEACDAFDLLGLDSYDDGYTQILMLDANTDQGNTLNSIINLTHEMLEGLLHQHSVRFDDDAPLKVLIPALHAIAMVPTYENRQQLIDIAQQPSDSNERFAEIVAALTKLSVEDVLFHLEYVSPQLLLRVAALADGDGDAEFTEEERGEQLIRIAKFKAFLDFVKARDLQVQVMVGQGMDAGYPFELYLNMISDQLESWPVERSAQELIGIAYLSEEGFGNPEGTISSYLERVISDTEYITKLSVVIRQLVLDFIRKHG